MQYKLYVHTGLRTTGSGKGNISLSLRLERPQVARLTFRSIHKVQNIKNNLNLLFKIIINVKIIFCNDYSYVYQRSKYLLFMCIKWICTKHLKIKYFMTISLFSLVFFVWNKMLTVLRRANWIWNKITFAF